MGPSRDLRYATSEGMNLLKLLWTVVVYCGRCEAGHLLTG